MRAFLKRNLLVFFKDRAAVFFSLLSTLIILGIYILFLGNSLISGFHDMVPNARELMTNWIMAGMIAANTATTTLGGFGVLVGDKASKIDRDLYVSPISRRKLAAGYVLSAFIIGFIMTFITFVVAEIYIFISSGNLINLPALLKMTALILLSALSSTSMMFFITTFFSSPNAFATISTIVGTLIGFLTGIYIPIGQLPEAVQWIVKLFPPSYAAVLVRQAMMAESMKVGFAGVPDEYVEKFKEKLGVVLKFGETEASDVFCIAVLLGSAAIFFLLAVLVLSRKKKE
ncbi:MAG: ABC transporter permease [Eubacteriales bacterium]|jgi:multidrug/hemolysin transport system permease protein